MMLADCAKFCLLHALVAAAVAQSTQTHRHTTTPGCLW